MQYECGKKFHDLTLLSLCGSGSFGEVYLASDISGRTLAVKIISKNKLGNCWQREFKGLVNYKKILNSSPNLLHIYHIGEDDDYFYYTMEAADAHAPSSGKYCPDTLASRIAHGPLAPGELVRIIEGILNGINVIHQAGLSHRDIKPSNIIFVKNVPKIGDIGLMTSEQSMTVHFAGTLEFMPPETRESLLMGNAPIPSFQHADLYALGRVIYCAMTGKSPTEFPSLPGNMAPSEAFRRLNKIVLRSNSPDPFLRINSASEFRLLLSKVKQKPSMIKRLRAFFMEKNTELIARVRRCFLFTLKHKVVFLITIGVFFALFSALALRHPEIIKTGMSGTSPAKTTKEFVCKTGEISMKIPAVWLIAPPMTHLK